MGWHTRLVRRRARAGCGAVEAPRALGGRRGGPGRPAARASPPSPTFPPTARPTTCCSLMSLPPRARGERPASGHVCQALWTLTRRYLGQVTRARRAAQTSFSLLDRERFWKLSQEGAPRPRAPAPARAVHAAYAVHAAHAARPDFVLQSPLSCPFVGELTHRNARRGEQVELQELQRRGVRSDVVRVVGPLSEELRAARCKVRNPPARVLCRGCRVAACPISTG